ncbi:MAG: hypothetical protein HGA60_01005 [Chlorobiaceae bacterium]|nr:hypothetical protein [Chlorobiaceae bacterium]
MVDLNQQAPPDNNLKDMLNTLWKGKFIIAAVAILATAGALAHYYISMPSYKAQALIMVKSPVKEKFMSETESRTAEYELPTSIELLKSYPLAETAVKTLLDSASGNQLELFGTRGTKGGSSGSALKAPDSTKTRKYAEILQHRIKTDNIRGTNLVEISVTSPYPDEAALLTNTVCETYQRKNAEWNAAMDISVSKTIEQQITEQEEKVRQAEAALRDFMQSNEVYEATGNVLDLQKTYASASSEYDANRVQYEILRKQLAFIEQTLSDDERTFSRNLQQNIGTQLRSMRETIREKENAYIALAIQKGPNAPEVQAAQNSLTNLKTQYEQVNRTKLAGEIANSTNAQKYRFDLLASKMQANVRLAELDNSAREYQRLKDYYQGQLNALPAKQITYSKLALDSDIAKKTYAFLKEKLDESRIKTASNSGGVVIIKKAFVPLAPESPNLLQNLAIGIGGGLLIGMLAVIMKEKMV